MVASSNVIRKLGRSAWKFLGGAKVSIKKICIVLCTSAIVFAGCSASKVSVEEAEMGYIVGFGAVMAATFSAAFDKSAEGVTLSEDKLTMTMESYDLSQFTSIDYTEASGTVVNKDGIMQCDLELVGGPVKTIKFEIGDINNMSHVQATIEANGRKVDIDITEDEFEVLKPAG
jgi:hypothetical protein